MVAVVDPSAAEGAALDAAAIHHLFVYGTLMPGHLRWSWLADHAVAQRPAAVPGVLWDTGNGWPAATFAAHDAHAAASPTLVPGWLVELRPGSLARLLADLDAMEGLGSPPDPERDPYRRVVLGVEGVDAWAYHATRVPASWEVIDAWSGREER